jgi:GGDEF domain-containing protein
MKFWPKPLKFSSPVWGFGVVGRIGGEEFMILCPETNKTQAIMVGERIRKKWKTWSGKRSNLDW